ncbi:DUF4339 domain-containing protein [Dactylosporangium darangshiense]|uniref:DUF4339 domain-containing protein n=1 Tax=Dactylosporangium darangshiense TaxID=579108 RepID=UPI00363636A1
MPQQDQWFAGVSGQQGGPFDLNALGAQVQGGAVTRTTLVWKNGMAQWTPAGQVPELGSLFAAVPPPFPPQG